MRYFDLHCDTAYECFRRSVPFQNDVLAVTPEKGKAFSDWKQCFAMWISDDAENPFELYKKMLSGFKDKLKEAPDNLTVFLAVEGGAVIENELSRIEVLKNDGVRMLTLTWNGKNAIASGCKEKGGVTAFGRSVICEMNRMKICCDLSHLNKESFWDAVELADYPIATHSCCEAVFSHTRNLDDNQLKAIAQKGGVIGICFYPEFLGGNDVFERIYQNIIHMRSLGIHDNIAIGSDFDGADMDEKLCDISKTPQLYDFLGQKGIDITLLDKIFYENAKKFLLRL